jgi:FtsH-binding integral membrane protein
MTEDNENVEVSGMSKFMRITLTIIAALLIFVGPTYIPYLLSETLGVNYVISIVVGLVLFIVGLVMLFWLIRKKIVT